LVDSLENIILVSARHAIWPVNIMLILFTMVVKLLLNILFF